MVVRKWNRPQSDFMKSAVRFVDFEGAVRSGKTTPLIWKLINYAIEYPGIKMLLARWTGDALDMQLKPKFYEECPSELLGRTAASRGSNENGWNAKEEYQEFTNGSMLYMRSLKSSDDGARYAKFTGLTLAVIGIDQPEETPYDVFQALKGRLSQIGYPQQMLLTPNPPGPGHWLADEFPEDNHLEGHVYISTSTYDNRHIIGDDYIRELEREYPAGHAMRRRMLEGKRGLSLIGDAVYGKVFSRDMHVREVEWLPDYPLIESWDFGQKHPAVSWHQYLPWGWWNILGEYMYVTKGGQFIDQTIPAVAQLRNELFPHLLTLQVCCDPAGADKQGHGIRHTAVEVLNTHLRALYGPENGARFLTGSNRPEKRDYCIQQISSRMGRLIQGRPALLVHPRCGVIIDGFEAGYVFDDRMLTMAAMPNFRRPKKDGFYDHLQNTVEYAELNFGSSQVSPINYARMNARERLHQLQRDPDESDTGARKSRSRAGY